MIIILLSSFFLIIVFLVLEDEDIDREYLFYLNILNGLFAIKRMLFLNLFLTFLFCLQVILQNL